MILSIIGELRNNSEHNRWIKKEFPERIIGSLRYKQSMYKSLLQAIEQSYIICVLSDDLSGKIYMYFNKFLAYTCAHHAAFLKSSSLYSSAIAIPQKWFTVFKGTGISTQRNTQLNSVHEKVLPCCITKLQQCTCEGTSKPRNGTFVGVCNSV